MTALLIFATLIVLVVLMVRHHERRSARAPQPWTEAVVDRDAQRIRQELGGLV